MRRVVVTGMGIVSSIGTGRQAVLDSLRAGRSGIRLSEEYRTMGFRSHVHGPIDLPLEELIDRKLKRFMSDGAGYNYLALREAIEDAALDEGNVSNPRTGLIVGSGGASTENVVWCATRPPEGRAWARTW
jgi:3-oxoacyl-[acyl-carrier-protein] synthase-1